MNRALRTALAGGAAAAATLGTMALGAPAAVSAPHAGSPATGALQATITKHKFTLQGAKSFNAGRAVISLKSVGAEHEVALMQFKGNYNLKDLRKDEITFGRNGGGSPQPKKKALKALHHALKHTTFVGGVDSTKGETNTMTIVLTPGKYVIVDDSGNLPKRPKTLTVSGPEAPSTAPVSTGTVTAEKSKPRFGGDKTLPAKGTITFTNHSSYSPHFLVLNHVKEGTTKKQVLKALQQHSNKRPKFALKGGAGTDAVSEGMSQTLEYSLPKGQYVELCFFPDPQTGMPHALMGMIRMVHLK